MANKPTKIQTELEKSQQVVAHCYPEAAHLLPYLGEMVHTIAGYIVEAGITANVGEPALHKALMHHVDGVIFCEKMQADKRAVLTFALAIDSEYTEAQAEVERLEKLLASATARRDTAEKRVWDANTELVDQIEAVGAAVQKGLSAIRDLATFGRLAGFWESTLDLGGIAGATEGIHLALRTQEANLRITDAVALHSWLSQRRQGHYLTLSAKLGSSKVKASFVDELLKQAIADGSSPVGVEFGQVSLVKKGDLLTDGLPFITIEVSNE